MADTINELITNQIKAIASIQKAMEEWRRERQSTTDNDEAIASLKENTKGWGGWQKEQQLGINQDSIIVSAGKIFVPESLQEAVIVLLRLIEAKNLFN